MQVSELTALEVIKYLGNGINLGNTMEAYGHLDLGTEQSPSTYETYWGQPITTKEMIVGMKTAGFDTLRIPVAWTNTMNYEEGDYTINQAYLDRVEELIDYALEADMFVIINDDWDGGWWGMFGSSSIEVREVALTLYTEMWKQIAEEYKNKSYKLLFESGNEELGDRLNDKNICFESGALSENDCYETVNKINQTFVNTIRATGGNNKERFLLISGYNTDITMTCDSRFQMPKDIIENKLLLSVQFYNPVPYCIFSNLTTWGTPEEIQEMTNSLAKLEPFTKQGYGVVFSEWGVLFDGINEKQDRQIYMNHFLDLCKQYHYCPILWDSNNLYNKTTCTLQKDYKNYFLQRKVE